MIKGGASNSLSVGLHKVDQLASPAPTMTTGPGSVASEASSIKIGPDGKRRRVVRRVRKVPRSSDSSVRSTDSSTVVSRASSRASQKDELAREIKRIEAELEKARLEAEIKKMEAAISLQKEQALKAQEEKQRKKREEKEVRERHERERLEREAKARQERERLERERKEQKAREAAAEAAKKKEEEEIRESFTNSWSPAEGMQSASELIKSEICRSSWAYSDDDDEDELDFEAEREEIDFETSAANSKTHNLVLEDDSDDEAIIRLEANMLASQLQRQEPPKTSTSETKAPVRRSLLLANVQEAAAARASARASDVPNKTTNNNDDNNNSNEASSTILLAVTGPKKQAAPEAASEAPISSDGDDSSTIRIATKAKKDNALNAPSVAAVAKAGTNKSSSSAIRIPVSAAARQKLSSHQGVVDASSSKDSSVIRIPVSAAKAKLSVKDLQEAPKTPTASSSNSVIRLPVVKKKSLLPQAPKTPTKSPGRNQTPVTPTGRAGLLAMIKTAATERAERSERSSLQGSSSTLGTTQSTRDAERQRLEEEIRLAESKIQANKKKNPATLSPVPHSPNHHGSAQTTTASQAPSVLPLDSSNCDEDDNIIRLVPKRNVEREHVEEEIPQKEGQTEAKKQETPAPNTSGRSGFLAQVARAASTREQRRADDENSVTTAKSQRDLERQKLEEEIRQMEAQIHEKKKAPVPQAAASPPRNRDSSSMPAKDFERKQLEEEIRQMEAGIAKAQGRQKEPTSDTSPVSSPPNFLSAITQAATEREARVEDNELQMQEVEPVVVQPRGPPSFLSAIAQAATEREARIEENDGELHMQEVEPEVEAKPTTPQLSFALAEMVTKKARDREKRLEEGGEKKITIIKEKEEYKKEFSDICQEAAAMGRLTRFEEHEVESVAMEKTPEEEWRSQGLLAIQWRSNHMSIIHEAAAFGEQTKMSEHVVSNYPEEDELDQMYEEEEKTAGRLQELLNLNTQAGTGTEKVEALVLGLREENNGGESMIIRPMVAYSNIEEVHLPKELPPSIDIGKHKQRVLEMQRDAEQNHRPMIDISHDVAQVAWERRTRLNRPGSMPKIRGSCDCPYCGTASPYQTYAYRVIEQRRKHMTKEQRDIEDEHRRLHGCIQPHEGHAGSYSPNHEFVEDVEVEQTYGAAAGDQHHEEEQPRPKSAGMKLQERLESKKKFSKRNVGRVQEDPNKKPRIPASPKLSSPSPHGITPPATSNQCCACIIL